MLYELINETVEVVVAFGSAYVSGGSVPTTYKGILIEVNDNFCKLNLLVKSKDKKSIIIISNKFLISVKQI
ncbi:MAG: hypothetical protein M0R05_05245 [Bacilli bacterium]|nr:hypothetical protein [Bacilli bacterium]MDD4388423.1 hypothetical protein [Bacilli bacterium]